MAARALGLLLLVSATQTSRAEPCAPRAELGGDAEAVASVAAELKRLGVEASTTKIVRSECPVIVAAVELEPTGGIAVAVRDSTQRSEGRVVSDAALAAAWIDSWLRDDFEGGSIEPPAAAPVAPPVETPAPIVAETPLIERFSLAASYVAAWSDDETSWSGFAVSGCARTGGFCIGGRVGYAKQDISANGSGAAKRDVSVLATASYPQGVGRMSIAPEVGLGVGRLTTTRIEGCKLPTMCDPTTDPMCDPNTMPTPCETDPGTIYVGDDLAATTYTPRIAAALRIAIPIFDHVWLDGLVAATAAPFGHGDDYGTKPPDGMVMPNTGYAPLPGDPTLGIQLGIGLRIGAR